MRCPKGVRKGGGYSGDDRLCIGVLGLFGLKSPLNVYSPHFVKKQAVNWMVEEKAFFGSEACKARVACQRSTECQAQAIF